MAMRNIAHSDSSQANDKQMILDKIKIYYTSSLPQHEIDRIVQSLLLKEEHQ